MITLDIVLISIVFLHVSFQMEKLELKESPLPRNFWPNHQLIIIAVNADPETKTDNMMTLVNISLRRTSSEPANEITLHAGNMNIWETEVLAREKNQDGFHKLEDITTKHDIEKELLVIDLKNPKVEELFLFIRSAMNFTTNPRFLTGVYHPYRTHDIVTQFEMSYARTAFPCFDDPHFQTKFQIIFDLIPNTPKEMSIGLSNMPLKNYDSTWAGKGFIFEETPNPIPSYLIAFALLNSSFYSPVMRMDYFGVPITFYEHSYDPPRWNWMSVFLRKDTAPMIKSVVHFTLAYCEQLFNSKFDWPKLDFVVTETSFGGMENPGLIIIKVRSVH